MKELWKVISFESNYEVSNTGKVRNKETLKEKSLRKNRGGYLRVTLYPSGKTYTVHQLVARTWLEDSYKEGLEIDHLDCNKENNTVNNLEWVTQQENIKRISERGRKANISGSKNPQATISEETAYIIKYSFDKPNSVIAKELNVSLSIVEKIRGRERWVHIINEKLEKQYKEKQLKYAKASNANIDKSIVEELDKDILSGKYKVAELIQKYGVSKATVYRHKRKLNM